MYEIVPLVHRTGIVCSTILVVRSNPLFLLKFLMTLIMAWKSSVKNLWQSTNSTGRRSERFGALGISIRILKSFTEEITKYSSRWTHARMHNHTLSQRTEQLLSVMDCIPMPFSEDEFFLLLIFSASLFFRENSSGGPRKNQSQTHSIWTSER